MTQPITRRTVLRGLGTTVALPWLDAFSRVASAASPSGASLADTPPRRAAFVYVPNGVVVPDWQPTNVGPLGKLPDILAGLEPYKKHLNVISNLALDKARANGDGPGDHARAMSVFLTGRQPRKTSGSDIRIGLSADQHIARAIGDNTRFPSLELGIERGAQAGSCDSGYSCAYSSNLSWRGDATPNAKEVDPKLLFDRLFAGNDPKELAAARAKKELYNKSVLDFALSDAKALTKTLGHGDQGKLDEFLTSVRDVERQIERVKKQNAERKPLAKPDMAAPAGIPQEFTDHVKLMCDLMVLSFQMDLTRVITLPFANDGSNRPYKSIGVPEGHHDLSHHGKSQDKLAKLKKINTHHMEMFTYLVGKMSQVKEANGTTLLDNIIMVYGSGIGDGDRHNHDELPILLVGGGGGSIQGGRHIKPAGETPLMNLYLAMFERLGAPTTRFGDSTGVLPL